MLQQLQRGYLIATSSDEVNFEIGEWKKVRFFFNFELELLWKRFLKGLKNKNFRENQDKMYNWI